LLNHFLVGAVSGAGDIMPVSLPPGDQECHVHLTLYYCALSRFKGNRSCLHLRKWTTKHMCVPSLEVLSCALTLRGFVNLHQHQLV
jgi:hypothetical protein